MSEHMLKAIHDTIRDLTNEVIELKAEIIALKHEQKNTAVSFKRFESELDTHATDVDYILTKQAKTELVLNRIQKMVKSIEDE